MSPLWPFAHMAEDDPTRLSEVFVQAHSWLSPDHSAGVFSLARRSPRTEGISPQAPGELRVSLAGRNLIESSSAAKEWAGSNRAVPWEAIAAAADRRLHRR